MVVLKQPIKERSKETGVSAKTISRRVDQFIQHGVPGFQLATVQRPDDGRVLPAVIRDFILARQAEYPALRAAEIATLCEVHFSRSTAHRTVQRILHRYP